MKKYPVIHKKPKEPIHTEVLEGEMVSLEDYRKTQQRYDEKMNFIMEILNSAKQG